MGLFLTLLNRRMATSSKKWFTSVTTDSYLVALENEDVLDCLHLYLIVKVRLLFHIVLLDLHGIWKVYLTKDFKF